MQCHVNTTVEGAFLTVHVMAIYGQRIKTSAVCQAVLEQLFDNGEYLWYE